MSYILIAIHKYKPAAEVQRLKLCFRSFLARAVMPVSAHRRSCCLGNSITAQLSGDGAAKVVGFCHGCRSAELSGFHGTHAQHDAALLCAENTAGKTLRIYLYIAPKTKKNRRKSDKVRKGVAKNRDPDRNSLRRRHSLAKGKILIYEKAVIHL